MSHLWPRCGSLSLFARAYRSAWRFERYARSQMIPERSSGAGMARYPCAESVSSGRGRLAARLGVRLDACPRTGGRTRHGPTAHGNSPRRSPARSRRRGRAYLAAAKGAPRMWRQRRGLARLPAGLNPGISRMAPLRWGLGARSGGDGIAKPLQWFRGLR